MTNNSASESLSKSSIDGKVVIDSLGRKITLRNTNIMERVKAFESVSLKDDEGRACLRFLLYISAIEKDDDVFLIPHPINGAHEFYSLLLKVKDEGLSAVVRFLNENDSPSSSQEVEEKIKK